MIDRVAIYGVPALAGAVTAAVLLGPGREQPIVGARVWGFIAEGATETALRVHTVMHYGGAYLSTARDELELTVEQQGHTIGRWQGASPEGGLAEALLHLDEPIAPGAVLRVATGDRPLAEAVIALSPPLSPVVSAPLSESPIVVRVPRGTVAPPFAELVEVEATTPASDEEPKLVARAPGAKLRVLGKPERHCDERSCRHRWKLEASVEAPTARLEVAIAHAEGELTWQGELPVDNGAMWLDPSSARSGEITVRAPAPHSQAFLSLFTGKGRVWGAIVPMTTALDGVSSARVAFVAPKGAATLALSSDAQDDGVGWPLKPELGAVPVQPLLRLADGLPARVAFEQARYRAARRPAYGIVIAAALFELFFLWRQNRLTRARLEAHLRNASDAMVAEKVAGSVPLLWLSLLAGGLALAFAILAAVAAWA